jgi:hypothetical protein
MVPMKPDITIIVSSCDAYADCWEPFFQLFHRYWPHVAARVVLITDEMDYASPHMEVTTFRAAEGQGGRRRPWGWNLRRCLASIDTQLILYLQDDYFLTGPVDENQIIEFAGYMTKRSWTHESTMHIGLSPRSSHGPFHLTEYPLLWEVDRQARYRFSLQPGLWNREEMLKHIKPKDTAWDFEEKSDWRSRRTISRVLTVNRHVFRPAGRLIYPSEAGGGIVRGKWVRENVVELFAKHEIHVDFSRRGFFDEASQCSKSLPFGARVCNAVHWRGIRLLNRINEAIDHLRT